jgi:alpha-tubulin suppressor-like RCC1 family protein
MFSWGRCDNGQLGLGGVDDIEVSFPKLVSDLPIEPEVNIDDIKAGEAHTVILATDGKVFTCGSNDFGQVLQLVL